MTLPIRFEDALAQKPNNEQLLMGYANVLNSTGASREDVTRTLAFAQFTFQQPELPEMPDFVTQHIDPFTGEDDTVDIDAGTGAVLSRLPPLTIPQPEMPAMAGAGEVGEVPPPASRNSPCPCGSGRKYKRCHGAQR